MDPQTLLQRWLHRLVEVRPEEVRALLGSFAYFFFLLAGYYVLRPLRDEMGIAGGVRALPWLFTATFFVMLAAIPLYGALVARLPRRRFIPLVYQFFVANIAIFWLLLALGIEKVLVARVFFVWISVFNLFVVSVFWSFMADLYAAEQGKRLFGFIAAGGSAGALLGPLVTVALASPLGATNLLIVAALLLEGAVWCVRRLERYAPQRDGAHVGAGAADASPDDAKILGGTSFAGIVMVLRSPYLAGIALWVALLSVLGTFLYFQQASIVAAASDDPVVRTRIFATIDLIVGVLAILVQFCATGRLIVRFGVGAAAALLPFVFAAGFAVLAFAPALAVIIVFQALQRTANFALSNPAREILFTVAGREEKYKAKNVIDGVVFRGSDAVAGWLYESLRALGLTLPAISLVAIPLAALWLALALALGRDHERRAREQTAPG